VLSGLLNYCYLMGFIPSELVKTQPKGEISYLLERNNLLEKYSLGEVSIHDICDAHPELIRAAHNYSIPIEACCPICEDSTLVKVSYVFGPRLPSHGRCVNTKKDLDRIRKRKGTFTCYEIEVCTKCSWNHLSKAFTL